MRELEFHIVTARWFGRSIAEGLPKPRSEMARHPTGGFPPLVGKRSSGAARADAGRCDSGLPA
jgi:hypothetical protein